MLSTCCWIFTQGCCQVSLKSAGTIITNIVTILVEHFWSPQRKRGSGWRSKVYDDVHRLWHAMDFSQGLDTRDKVSCAQEKVIQIHVNLNIKKKYFSPGNMGLHCSTIWTLFKLQVKISLDKLIVSWQFVWDTDQNYLVLF